MTLTLEPDPTAEQGTDDSLVQTVIVSDSSIHLRSPDRSMRLVGRVNKYAIGCSLNSG